MPIGKSRFDDIDKHGSGTSPCIKNTLLVKSLVTFQKVMCDCVLTFKNMCPNVTFVTAEKKKLNTF
jgi:hypothetical protein